MGNKHNKVMVFASLTFVTLCNFYNFFDSTILEKFPILLTGNHHLYSVRLAVFINNPFFWKNPSLHGHNSIFVTCNKPFSKDINLY